MSRFFNPLAGIEQRRFGHRVVYPANAAEIVRALVMGVEPPPASTDWIGWKELAGQLSEPQRTVEGWMSRARRAREVDRQATEADAA
jgi:hypothetical protein